MQNRQEKTEQETKIEEKVIFHGDQKQISGCQGLGQRGVGRDCLMGGGFPFGVLDMFWNEIVLIVAQD